jgi:predicted 3-demethylubiquinone-9 3-methyltransferase (glyoxalase superfamily)
MLKVSTCLWFEKDVEEAVRFCVSLVPGSDIKHVQRSPGPWPGGEIGDVILVSFSLSGQNYLALNGGAPADYGTAASIAVECPDQAEVDRLWAALTGIACGGNGASSPESLSREEEGNCGGLIPWAILDR